MPVVTDFTGILAVVDSPNAVWNATHDLQTPVIVTFSFADRGNVPTVGESAYSVGSTSAFTEAQRANFRDALVEFEQAAGIIFVEVEEGGMIDVSNAHGSRYGGWASYPWVSDFSTSDGIFVIDSTGSYDPGTYGYQTILHEMGHALGLEHPFEGSLTLDSSLDNQWNTVMTYNNQSPYTTVLGGFDVEALQYLYGESVDVSGWRINFREGSQTLKVKGDGQANVIFGSGNKNLLLGGSGSDHLIGREHNDKLKGGRGKDTLDGGDGNDVLDGGKGRDLLISDIFDADTIVFRKGYGKDTVQNFSDYYGTLRLDDNLWNGDLTAQEVVDQFASVRGGDVVFDFGRHELRLEGVSDLYYLESAIQIV